MALATPMRTLSSALALLGLLVRPSLQDEDPITNFCRRWAHRTAVVNNILYIDGGLLNWPSDNAANAQDTNVTNTFFLNQPLWSVASSGMPQVYNNITKPGSAPSTAGGALWADNVNNKLYLYGGEYTNRDSPPSSASLWEYDITHNNWSSVAYQQTLVPHGLAYGASASPPGSGFGYYYGGWQSKESDASWTNDVAAASSRLLIYNMDTQTWQNSSAPDDDLRRAEGVLVYLPMSDTGMLVYIGGVVDQYANGTLTAQDMDTILLYDIANARWYSQKASGDIPNHRRRFCADAAWSEDRSSYNIYLYGGETINDSSPGYDDSYILSLPSFKWIKFYETINGNTQHYSSTCNMVSNGAQMLVIGGSFPATDQCDVSDKWGTHNMDTGVQNDNNAQWYTYVPTKTSYAVPSAVRAVIGGDTEGHATLTTPSSGFDNSDLASYVTRIAATPTRTPISSSSSAKSNLSGGAIAGIVIGSTAFLLFLATIAFLLIRRRHTRLRSQRPAMIPYVAAPGAPGGPWSPLGAPPGSVSPQSPMGQAGVDTSYLAAQHRVPVELPTADAYNYQPPQTGPIQLPGGTEGMGQQGEEEERQKGTVGSVAGQVQQRERNG